MNGASHEFMKHKTSEARKSLNPTLERKNFKKSWQKQGKHADFRYSSKNTLPQPSRRTPYARIISTKYTTGGFKSQKFDNMQDYNDCNPHLSHPYAFDSDDGKERTPQ
jgi:hypothetical protein